MIINICSSKTQASDETNKFNELSILERTALLKSLKENDKTEYNRLVKTLRKQAVIDAWNHERDLIEQGRCSRNWTPEQIETIMNISTYSGKKKKYADSADEIMAEENGEIKFMSYYGHHMVSVSEHPEYAGEWRNIQFLDYDEHYNGAHSNHHTEIPTKGYYDPIKKQTIVFNLTDGVNYFDALQDCPPKTDCIFKSTEYIRNIFGVDENAKDGEILALKNLDYSMSDDGKLDDFERSLSLAEKYKADNFLSKYGILSDTQLKAKYNINSVLSISDINVLRAFEYMKDKIDDKENLYSKLGLLNDTALFSKYLGLTGDALRVYDYICNLIVNDKVTVTMESSLFGSGYSQYKSKELQQFRCGVQILNETHDTKLYGLLNKQSDDILSLINKDSITIGDYTFSKASSDDDKHDDLEDIIDDVTGNAKKLLTQMDEVSDKGTKISLKKKDIGSAADALADGFSEVKGTNGNIFTKIEDGVVEIYSTIGINLDDVSTGCNVISFVLDVKQFEEVTEKFQIGNYREAVGDITELCGSFGGSVLGTAATTALVGVLCVACGVEVGAAIVITGIVSGVAGVVGGYVGGVGGRALGDKLCDEWNINDHNPAVNPEGIGGIINRNQRKAEFMWYVDKILSKYQDIDSINRTIGRDIFEKEVGKIIYPDGKYDDDLSLSDFFSIILESYSDLLNDSIFYWNLGSNEIENICDLIDIMDGVDGFIYGEDDLVTHLFSDTKPNIMKYVHHPLVERNRKKDELFDDLDRLLSKNNATPEDYNAFMEDHKDLLQDPLFYKKLSVENLAYMNMLTDNLNELNGEFSYKKYMEENVLKRINGINDAFHAAEKAKVDPLIIDLDKNGFELTSVEDGVHFDMDSNGIAEKTGWVKGDDAFLVLDRNGNGVIDNSGEMFGDRTVLQNGKYASSGFEALAEYDSNMDGFINAEDEVFGELKLWQDKNQDGISTSDELHSLSDFGISALNLDYTGMNLHNEELGSVLANLSSAVFNDGTETSIGEFKFEGDKIDTTDRFFDITEDIKKLPNVRAIGNVHSLHYAMAMDDTGKIKELVESFVNSDDIIERKSLVEEILYLLCGVSEGDGNYNGVKTKSALAPSGASDNAMFVVSPVSTRITNDFYFSKKLRVLEMFLAEEFQGVNGSIPNSAALPILETCFEDIVNSYYGELASDGVRKYLCAVYATTETRSDGSKKLNTELLNALVKHDLRSNSLRDIQIIDIGIYLMTHDIVAFSEYKTDLTANNVAYSDLIEKYCSTITGTSLDDTLSSSTDNAVISGLDGNDTIYGSENREVMSGGTGDDRLFGRRGDDILDGGNGNDYLEGSEGNDTYIFNLGDGVDTIYDYEYSNVNGKSDRIVFGEGIKADDLVFERNGNSLTIKYSETDKVTINDAYRYDDGRCFVENIEFADGTKWDTDEIKLRANIRPGTDNDETMYGYGKTVVYDNNETFNAGAGNDTVYANDGNDIVNGESGDDRLYGGQGNDTLNGGIGNDHIEGNEGNDTYIFNLGDGVDTIYDYEYSDENGKSDRIVFGEGIKADDLVFERNGNSLIIKYSETDRVTINDAYRYNDGRCFVENIEFADGTKWDTDEIKLRASIRPGTDAGDTMYGYVANVVYDNNETFNAGAGNDTVYANDGNDIVNGESGDDRLYGGQGNDTLNGGIGNDHIEGSEGNDTYIFNLGDGVDTIYDYEYSDVNGKSDRIVFGEGIKADDLVFERNGNSLTIKYSEIDKVTINDAYRYDDGRCFVENIEFADGTKWDTDEIKLRANIRPGTDNDETMYGYCKTVVYDNNETFNAGDGNDTVYANDGNDIVNGESGDDRLYGGQGDDTLNGSIGDDRIEGNEGNDTYIFNLGDGVDTIYDYEYSDENGKSDRIVFGEGIKADDLVFERNGNSLIIKYSETDRVTINDAYRYNDGRCFVENIEFADGTKWDTDEIKHRASIRPGTDGDDTLYGYGANVVYDNNETFNAGDGNDTVYANDGNDIVNGESGDDKLYGGQGDDTLNGGIGNDHIEGNEGNDTYIFNLGDGVDTIYDYEYSDVNGKSDRIVFGEGIKAEDLIFDRNGNSLTIKYSETDMVTINDAYRYDDGRCFIENVEFADGTKWDTEEIKLRASIRPGTDGDDTLYGYGANVVYDNNETFNAGDGNDTVYANDGNDIVNGESGDDKLYGGQGDDTLNGGIGNDHIEGNEGNDTYIFNLGDGVDTIYDYEYSNVNGKSDRIVFGEGIKADDLVFERNGNSLTIKYSETDRVTINDAYRYDDGRCFIENIEFADGTFGTIDYSNLCFILLVEGSTFYHSDNTIEECNTDYTVEEIVDQCVLSWEKSSIDSDEDTDKQICNNTPYGITSEVDTIVNLVVQDLAEYSVGALSETESAKETNNSSSNLQLWID